MNNKKVLRAWIMSMLVTTGYGGNWCLAAEPIPSNGDLIASDITGAQTFNTVTVTNNTDATIQQGTKSYSVKNTSENGWNVVSGAKGMIGSGTDEVSYIAGNVINIQGKANDVITIHSLRGGENENDGDYKARHNSLMNNIMNIGNHNESGGTLMADEIIGGFSGQTSYPKALPYDNVINFNHMTVENATGKQRLKIYGGKVGDEGYASQIGNVIGNVINVQDKAVLKNADIYAGYTYVPMSAWGGNVKDVEINLSGQSDLSNTNLYGADISKHGDNKSSVLNIGYKENYTLHTDGKFPDGDALNTDRFPSEKGTCLMLTPEWEAWQYGKDTSIQNVGEFTAVKVWTMVDEDTPAIRIHGTGNFIYHTRNGSKEQGATIDVTPLTDGKDNAKIFFTNLKPDDQRTIIEAQKGIYEKDGVKVDLKSKGLNYTYNLAQGKNGLAGSYKGDAAIDGDNVVWKTGDVTVSSVDIPQLMLDDSGKQVNLLSLERYGYVFNQDTKFSTEGVRVIDEDRELIAPSDSLTLIDGSAARSLSGMDALNRTGIPVSYDMNQGAVTVEGNGSISVSADRKKLDYHIGQTDRLTYHTLNWDDTQPVISLTPGKAYNLKNTKVDWSALQHQGLANLHGGKNDRTLLDTHGAESGLTDQNLKGMPQHLVSGTTLEGTGQAAVRDGNLIYTADMHAQEQTHNVLMGGEAGLAALLESNDLILDTMKTLEQSKEREDTFATVGGGQNRYETGSHITTNIWRGQAGLAKRDKNQAGAQTAYGIFYDYGNGNYRTFSHSRGDGSINYKGGGLFVKYLEPNGSYEEASFRVGRASNDARNLLFDEMGKGYGYRTNSMYNAFHAGFGRISPQSDGGTLDAYCRFFHTHLNGDTFEAGGHYVIDSLDSDVIRIGSRYQKQDKNWKYFGGLAYEYEFGGMAHGRADGADIESASIRGGSARFEYGTAVNLGNWCLTVNASDYAGKRQGFNGNISLSCKF